MADRAGKVLGNLWQLRLSALAAAVALGACTSPANPAADAGAGADGSADAAICNVQPHLKSIETEYFANSCALSHCHDQAQTTQGNLDLSIGKSRPGLVNAPAFQAKAKKAGKILVVPGHPEQSFLYEKLTQTTDGVLMPYGSLQAYDPDCSVLAVKKWIENGALDD
jgi:hypothetical protein